MLATTQEAKLLLADEMTLARRETMAFTQWTKHDYEVNWHHSALGQKLDDWINKKIRFLMVFAPPRTGKSEIVSRRVPALIHGRFPNVHILAGSYSGGLASEMTSDVQKIIDSDEYRELFPHTMIVPSGKKMPPYTRSARGHDIVGAKGKYRGAGVGGAFTGKGAHYLIIDDPIKNEEEADSEVYREKLWNWYSKVARSRLEKGGSVLITLTRWHQDDLAGRILKAMADDPNYDQFEVFSLPMIKDETENPFDYREPGEPLWPNKYDLAECRALKSAAGSRGWSALYQQQPTSSEGALIKREWLQWYKILPAVEKFNTGLRMSVDATFKDSKKSDYVAIQVWGRIGSYKYLLDQIRDKLSFTETCRSIVRLRAKWLQMGYRMPGIWIEDAANGSAIENQLRKSVTGIILVKPEGSKDARLSAVSPQFEAGNVWLPDPSIAPWVNDYVEELVGFPFMKHDDQVDATTQALRKYENSSDNMLRNLITI